MCTLTPPPARVAISFALIEFAEESRSRAA
jgi:hypothetical protein